MAATNMAAFFFLTDNSRSSTLRNQHLDELGFS